MMALTYEQVCKQWARADHWPLEDAIRLLLKELPKSLAPFIQKDKQLEYDLLHELATNCLGGSLVALEIDLGDGSRINPIAILEWADQKSVSVPDELRASIDHVRQQEQSPKRTYQRSSQAHMERCRGIAALLWKQEPSTTIVAMAARSEMRELGCNGRFYADRTIYNWIKSEAGSHQPGRPRKER